MTRAETLLWRYLKASRYDFEERQKADQRRDAFFVSEGFQVLRFTNEQVMSNLEGVVEAIGQAASSRASGLPLSPALPHKGGGSGENSAYVTENTGNSRGSQP
jgi:Protein of unknown function (DUF559)